MERKIPIQRIDENTEDYQKRLIAYATSQIELMFAYDTERKVDRYGELNEPAKKVLFEESDAKNLIDLIRKFELDIQNYEVENPNLKYRDPVIKIQKRLTCLSSR